MDGNKRTGLEELRRRGDVRKAGIAEPTGKRHSSSRRRWYEKPGWIILLLIIFFPAGIYLMFRYMDWDSKLKGGVCAIIAVLCVFGLVRDGGGKEPVRVDSVSDVLSGGVAVGDDMAQDGLAGLPGSSDGGTDFAETGEPVTPENAGMDADSVGDRDDDGANVPSGDADDHEHQWIDATCAEPKMCSVCGETKGSPSVFAHEWVAATCTEPKTCSTCGETRGDPEHDWTAATCTTPRTCGICGETDGEPLGHKLGSGTVTVAATCQTPGERTFNCTRSGCNYVETEAISVIGHVAGNWQELSRTSVSVTQAKYCKSCGIELERKETPVSGSGSGSVGPGSESWGGSSMTDEITGSLDKTAYWTDGGKSYHFSKDCPSLSRSKNIKEGTLQDALNAGKKDPCNNCADGS